MDPELVTALRRTRYLYLTTYSDAGKPGTVPTWCWLHEDAVYFTTQRASLKARRIKDSGRVTVHVGKKDGPAPRPAEGARAARPSARAPSP